MPPRRELPNGPVWFVAWFVILSLGLGWIFWNSEFQQVSLSMLAVPVMSAMLASQGFSWTRKLVYTSITLGLYLVGSALAEATGLVELAAQQLNSSNGFPSVWVALYMAYLSTFPFAMLVLFVGRDPSLLWSKKKDQRLANPAGSRRR